MTAAHSLSNWVLPSIAVIIPVYNEGRGIKRVLDVVGKVPMVAEIIVVDDGSTDGSVGMVVRAQDCDERICLVTQAKDS